ncbi:unnamed protein product [Brachionus calyciflorus]|uniref:Signal recognition particle 19 kDa protein n=1 Tax=Brachionus calyciflorus TaxID=104777 RepID=A0A813X8U7_9BILA|nr:unnamed protein product [Brachionus calyciflorus]
MASPIQLVSLSRRERTANINVGSFHPTKKHSDKARWICFYPSYINNKRTVSEGRKIPMKSAVENPTLSEIKDVLLNAGFSIELENKVFPRELNKYDNRGRIRVQLRNDDGTPVKSDFKDRESIFLYVAETIPKLKTRGAGGVAKSSTQTQSQASSTSSKKSGKKK